MDVIILFFKLFIFSIISFNLFKTIYNFNIIIYLKSGHNLSIKYISVYAICQSKKLLNLFFPPVRIKISGFFSIFCIQIFLKIINTYW